ncbi:MAG: hypothetical protein E6940_07685 [Clostridium septicum]|uniref:hypothetical protein n=1 Tax=Clostridium septicum TaxID=1504 RepID=UPI002590A40F|nr:hypothetical protein [Clostridium septicum]MDU1313930.1 hypothetical protein [Clostridium septicum]
MYFKKQAYESDMEILVTPSNLVTFTATVKSAGIKPNENGRKLVKAGTLIDAEGTVVTQTGGKGSEVLSTTPAGVLYKTVDVTNGDIPCSLVVEGYLRKDRVLDGFAEKAIEAIKSTLVKITFR